MILPNRRESSLYGKSKERGVLLESKHSLSGRKIGRQGARRGAMEQGELIRDVIPGNIEVLGE